MSGLPSDYVVPPSSADVTYFVGEQDSNDTTDKNIDELFQKKMEKVTLEIEQIETDVLAMSSHFEDFCRKDYTDSMENKREEVAFGNLKTRIQNMYLNLHALGDENLGFKSDYSDRVEALQLRVIEHQAVSLRFIEVIKELEVMHSKHLRVRKRRLMNMIVDTGLIDTKMYAKRIIEEGGNRSFMRELQLNEGVNAAECIRLRIEDHRKLDERVDALKTLIADTQVVSELQESLIKEKSIDIDLEEKENGKGKKKEKKTESKFQTYLPDFKVCLLFCGLAMIVACLVVGLSMRIKPEWFGLPSTFSPGVSEKGENKVIIQIQPPDTVEMIKALNQRLVL